MRSGRCLLLLLALSAASALRARELSAQARVISLVATSPTTLSVTVTSGSAQMIAAVTDNAINNFSSPVVIQTAWDVNPGQTNTMNLVAYFTIPAQAMVGGATQIPSSRIQGRVVTGVPTSFTAISQNGTAGVGSAGGSLLLFSEVITGTNKNSTRTDNLDLRLNLVGFPTLPPGSYAGVLNLRMVTQ